MNRKIAIVLATAGLLTVAAAPAHAGGHVSLSVGVGSPVAGYGYAPAVPAYGPTYYARPAPTYYGPPAPVYAPPVVYAPAPVYGYGPRYDGPRYYGPRYYGPRDYGHRGYAPRVVYRPYGPGWHR